MRETALLLMAAGAALTIVAGATVWRRSRVDGAILAGGGVLVLLHMLFWQSGMLPAGRAMAWVALGVGPGYLYLAGLVFAARFFFTRIRGWQRGVYLAGGLAALSPLILLFVVLPIMFMAGS